MVKNKINTYMRFTSIIIVILSAILMFASVITYNLFYITISVLCAIFALFFQLLGNSNLGSNVNLNSNVVDSTQEKPKTDVESSSSSSSSSTDIRDILRRRPSIAYRAGRESKGKDVPLTVSSEEPSSDSSFTTISENAILLESLISQMRRNFELDNLPLPIGVSFKEPTIQRLMDINLFMQTIDAENENRILFRDLLDRVGAIQNSENAQNISRLLVDNLLVHTNASDMSNIVKEFLDSCKVNHIYLSSFEEQETIESKMRHQGFIRLLDISDLIKLKINFATREITILELNARTAARA